MFKIALCLIIINLSHTQISSALSDSLPLQTIIAKTLSHYPELTNTSIKFLSIPQESTGKTTMTFGSLFHKNHRRYIIKINNDPNQTGFLLKDLTSEQQEAIIGHELAHVADFSHRNLFQMMGFGLSYLNKKKRRAIERAADLSTIQHGLGNELYQWSTFVLQSPLTTPAYKRMRATFYLAPEEIKNFTVSLPK